MSLGDDSKKEREITSEIVKTAGFPIIVVFILMAVSFIVGLYISPDSSSQSVEVKTNTVYICPDGAQVTSKNQCKPYEPITTTTVSNQVTTTTYNVSADDSFVITTSTLVCIDPPEDDCRCARWSCPKPTTTTTTCQRMEITDYEPSKKSYTVILEDEEFSPESIEAFVGDTIVVILDNRRGLYKIWNPVLNESITLKPEDIYQFSFMAKEKGYYQMVCSEYCKKNIKAEINVVKPYEIVCES